jgi:predicted DCC family thiol-disulfide oxidoreductase YuxK
MISLISELTDRKGRRAPGGWVFFDADCAICTSLARRFRRTLEKRGFGLVALQDPRVGVLLGIPRDRLLLELRVLTGTHDIQGGADAIVFLARNIWWAWPLYVVAQFPLARGILDAGYRFVARHRHCGSTACSPAPSRPSTAQGHAGEGLR